MQLYEMQVSKTTITRAEPALIPKGIIGAVVKLSFSAEWEGLIKTAVFRAGEVTKDVADIQDAVVIPAECTQEEGELLQLGIYGVDTQGTVAIPTLWASIGRITEAADPSGDETTDPSLPVWAQVLEMVKQLEEQGVTQREVEQAVADFFGGQVPPGRATAEGGEIFNFYTDPVYTGDDPPKEFPGNTAAKGAHAQNFGTHADGEYSSASGWVSTASGGISDAGGRETEASGYCAVTRGWETKAPGSCADAGGKGTEASGNYAFTRGLNTKATGTQSHAGGKESEATGTNAFAHGNKAKATNNTSFAIGEGTEASGFYAVASGYKTKASGTCSSASGRETEARQYASSAQGRGTIATARNQSVRGAYNIPDTVDGNGNGAYAEIVGGGTNVNNRENIYTLDWYGNAVFAGKVYSGGKELANVDKIPTTAAAVGAVPTSRTVNGKALSSNISLTASDVGAAPSGFGLGIMAVNGTAATNLDSLVSSGWYYVRDALSPIGQAGVLRTDSYQNSAMVHQTFYAGSGNMQGYILRRYSKVGVWQPWEWFNPPMEEDVEYRTTERMDNLPVYVKTFAFQPNVTATFGSGEYPHGITGFNYLCRISARTSGYVLPLITSERTVCVSNVDSTYVKFAVTKEDFTDYVSVTMWYTKK